VVFNEITTPAVQRAFKHPGTVDMNKVEAQQARRVLDRLVGYKISPLLWRRARRVLDRLVGYKISPLLWRRVKTRTSAGRVQSVALRLVVDREKEIRSFVTEEYWKIAADLLGRNEPAFSAMVTDGTARSSSCTARRKQPRRWLN